MPNLLLTDYCNRNCPYCFANEKVVHTQKKDEVHRFIHMDDLETVIRYLKKSGLDLASLLGGEPTLHPEFNAILNRFLDEGFRLRIFTNGLIPEKHLRYLASKVREKNYKIDIILNINHPTLTSADEWRRIEIAFQNLTESVTLSYNIYDRHTDFDFLVDVIHRYRLNKNIRFGLAQPIAGANNQYLDVAAYPEIGEKIAIFSEKCDQYNIAIGLDCGFVLCMFNEKQIGKLIVNNTAFSILCGSIIDIGPDLTVWRCFPLSKEHNVKLTEFEDEKQLKAHYDAVYKPYRRFGMMDACFDCKYLLRGQCTGGCIAHKTKRFQGMKSHDA